MFKVEKKRDQSQAVLNQPYLKNQYDLLIKLKFLYKFAQKGKIIKNSEKEVNNKKNPNETKPIEKKQKNTNTN